MTDKMTYQVDQLDIRFRQLHGELDKLNDEVREVEKEIIAMQGKAVAVEGAVDGIVETRLWVFRAFLGVIIAAVGSWIMGGGLDS